MAGGPSPSFLAWSPLGAIYNKLFGNRASLDAMNRQFRDKLYRGQSVWDYKFGVVTGQQDVTDTRDERIPLAWESGRGLEYKSPADFNADLMHVSPSALAILNFVIGANLLQPGEGKATKMRFEFREKNTDGAYSPSEAYGPDGKADPRPDSTDVIVSSIEVDGDPVIQITFWCPKLPGPAAS